MVILIGIATFFSTLLGGLFALRLKDRLHLILGFSAGAIIGVAFFDLMPEAFEIGTKDHSPFFITTLIAVGFLIYLVLDRSILLHGHHEEKDHLRRGSVGAGSLSIHSLLDGAGIGLAFKVSNALGIVVAVAVLTHDFSDGINTVSFILKNKGERNRAFRWLLVDASAPVIGILSTLFFTMEEATLGLLLALFSGFFLYIGASDLLPESHHAHPVMWTTFMTVLGMGVLYAATKLAMI
ncbi:MAG TPA: ZIP family metal transporter [Nitrospiria bacterium]|nr:ZIP family metal transporter [Nitrospiria bacterium]